MNSELLTVIPEMVTLVAPLLVTVTINVSAWPRIIAPNRSPVGVQIELWHGCTGAHRHQAEERDRHTYG